jgi:hypothetical protein
MSVLPEVWGGIECTINRVRNEFFNQCEWNGHNQREGDLERIAGLDIKALRYRYSTDSRSRSSRQRPRAH